MSQRRLGEGSFALETSLTRLSSGLRINRASDDAAGLAIADSLNVDKRVYQQGIRNLNDGISLLNIADSATAELSTMIIRIEELAEQAANGTVSNAQRKTLDEEAQALSSEVARILQTTEFNDMKLFDGSVQDISLQAGYGQDGSLAIELGTLVTRIVGDGTFNNAEVFDYTANTFGYRAATAADYNGDGKHDIAICGASDNLVSILLGNGDGSFQSPTNYSMYRGERMIDSADIDGDGDIDLVIGNSDDKAVTILLGNGDGSFSARISYAAIAPYGIDIADVDNDGFLDLVTASPDLNRVGILLGNGDGSFEVSLELSVGGGSYPVDIQAADLDRDGNIDLAVASSANGRLAVFMGNGDGTFEARQYFGVFEEICG